MKRADLYVRVSTDEQAARGYSQRDQEERLRRYCDMHHIAVRKVIYDDYSAKTFDRPGWSGLLEGYNRDKYNPDFVLFTKWDRFSRNTGDAYQMISTLRRRAVEPQAIEQPLDLSIPENKLMLAFYLASPEVENDRRALNTFMGMRKAKKEGRWMGCPPVGYINRTSETGKKHIVIDPGRGELMKWAFHEIASGFLAADQVRKLLVIQGLKCSGSTFYNAIRNPVYCGRIYIPAYMDEEAYYVKGQHQPLISEELFDQVQDILNGYKRAKRLHTTYETADDFPLRGFLECPVCGRGITGSASKGKYAYYSYYHCRSRCRYRYRADYVNRLFELELRKYVPHHAIAVLSKSIIEEVYLQEVSNQKRVEKQIHTEIDNLNLKIAKARNLLLSDNLDASDYKIIKHECEQQIRTLENKIQNSSNNLATNELKSITARAYNILTNIHLMYENGTSSEKRKIIGSIFTKKLIFDGKIYRTPGINKAAAYIYKFNYELHIEKNRKSEENIHSFGVVASPRIELRSKV